MQPGSLKVIESNPAYDFLLASNSNLLPARRYASAGLCDGNVSVRLSITRWYCVKTKKASVMISSLSGSQRL